MTRTAHAVNATASDLASHSSHPTELPDGLKDWVSKQTEPFTLYQAADSIGLSQQEMTRDLTTRVGVALRKIGCKKLAVRSELNHTRTMWARPDRFYSEHPAPKRGNKHVS